MAGRSAPTSIATAAGILAPHDRRLRQGARCAEGSGRRLLRPARSLHDRAALIGAGDALCEPRDDVRRTGFARRHAHRRHPRVDADAARRQSRRCRSLPPPRPRSNRCSAASSARPWSNRPIRSGSPIRDLEADEPRFPPGAGAAGAGLHARPVVPARRPTATPLFKEFAAAIRPTEFVPGKVFGIRHDGADRLSASNWPRAGSRRPRTSTSPRSSTRSWRWRSAFTSRNI